jgi:RNA polymerase sigma factor (TIGR02999 family)
MREDLDSSKPKTCGFDGSSDLDPEVYAELRRLAARRMRQQIGGCTFQPTMLVHEAWIRMSAASDKWKDRNHFLATAAVTMRHILIDNARRKASVRHGKGLARTDTGRLGSLASPTPNDDILLVNEGIQELEKIHPVRAQVVVARFFGGLSIEEVSECLGIAERSVERHWAAARLWLYKWMEGTRKQ